MQYVQVYFSLLREALEDIRNFFATFESDTSFGFILASAVLVPIFGCLFFFAVLVSAAEYTTPAPAAIIEAEQIDQETIILSLKHNVTPLNAAEIEFFFDPSHVQIENLSIAATLCEERFVITKEVDNDIGRIFYQCGTVTPFAGTSTTLATLTITPLAVGTSTIAFGTDTNVLAHDGYGTNVTKERIDSQFIKTI